MLGKTFICELRAIIGENRVDSEGKVLDQRFEKTSSGECYILDRGH